ncbi:MAG: hypothetical protein JOZ35_21255 [Hyphomicrobiales bacterium]|nr:hypothetical protein [Hyphomicrobiales bacterium]
MAAVFLPAAFFAAVFLAAPFLAALFFTAPLRAAFFATALRAPFFAAAFFTGLFLAADFLAVFLAAAFAICNVPHASPARDRSRFCRSACEGTFVLNPRKRSMLAKPQRNKATIELSRALAGPPTEAMPRDESMKSRLAARLRSIAVRRRSIPIQCDEFPLLPWFLRRCANRAACEDAALRGANACDDRAREAAPLMHSAHACVSIRNGAHAVRNRIFLGTRSRNFLATIPIPQLIASRIEANQLIRERAIRTRHTFSLRLRASLTACGLALPPVDFIT